MGTYKNGGTGQLTAVGCKGGTKGLKSNQSKLIGMGTRACGEFCRPTLRL